MYVCMHVCILYINRYIHIHIYKEREAMKGLSSIVPSTLTCEANQAL